MTAEQWSDIANTIESLATVISLAIGGLWIYWRFVRQREDQPNIDFSAEVRFVERHGDWWVVELIAVITNKGKVQHRLDKFDFDLNGLAPADPVELRPEWGNQLHFPQLVAKGSFLPDRTQYFFIAILALPHGTLTSPAFPPTSRSSSSMLGFSIRTKRTCTMPPK